MENGETGEPMSLAQSAKPVQRIGEILNGYYELNYPWSPLSRGVCPRVGEIEPGCDAQGIAYGKDEQVVFFLIV